MQSSSTFSADQKNSIQSILGKFDSNNLSVADAKKITSEFKKLGIQPGRELEETMAASGFDAKQVGGLAFGQGQSPGAGAMAASSKVMVSSALSELKSLMASKGTSSTASSTSEETASKATDAFLKTLFSQSADSRTANSANKMPQGAPPPGGPQGGNRPPPPPPSANTSYQGSSDIETYLASLISSITSGTDSTTSGVSASSGSSKVVQSASSLLKASGIEASSKNLQSFLQILQKNVTASIDDRGNLVDQSV
jgi:hypothetical protein